MPTETRKLVKARRKYPKCKEHPSGKHRFGVTNMSFQDVILYRDKDLDNICKCGFSRKEWRDEGAYAEAVESQN